MKKLLFLTLLFFVAQYTVVRAEQPIPSRHARIYHAGNFREHNNPWSHNPFLLKSKKEKRDMEIQVASSSSTPKSMAIVYVYSSDLNDIVGPFNVSTGDFLTVPIDDRDWGVIIESDDHIYVDVWTSGPSPE